MRFRLSLLYLAASLSLVALVAAGTYGLLALYFMRSTDLALQYKTATEFRIRGLRLPSELIAAEQAWTQDGVQLGAVSPAPATQASAPLSGETEDEDEEVTLQPGTGTNGFEVEGEERYDGRLAPVFVVPEGSALASAGMPVVNDTAAASQALRSGSDVRTITLGDGSRLRLLTYRTGDVSVVQVGRLLSDQDRLLSQFLVGLLTLGSTASLVLAVASWVFAGRTIRPAQHAMDQQQQFVSSASHELRAPLTLLRASADYALRTQATAERVQSLRDILDECDYMDRMVEDLLLLSRIDAHRLILAFDRVSLAELLPEIVRQVERVSAAKGVTLKLGPAAGEVLGDSARLRQAILILLDNALRFTSTGGTIQLEARIRGSDIAITVKDNGVGIPAEHLPHIFERFYQGPGQPGEVRGNGLGLSIARGLIEAQRGRVGLTSRPGEGTTAEIILPSVQRRAQASR